MRILRKLIILVLASSLAACGDNGVTELKEWMDQVKKEMHVKVTPVAEPKVFVPVTYSGGHLIDPFDSSKLLVVFARLKAANDNGLKPDFDRPKEALEGYALETMKMVGTIDNRKSLQGLIQIGKAVFPVVVGGYMGQNFGKVISINESRIDLVETVQDASGEWTERKASLELQEAKK
ncbi:pilus assembly protein PilP [Undibacterium fentianense]|uniref:Pilus assembly protein PilP n=1 Tax=Undibacterium fentianense TaxID=2828728 RepID=A0A941E5V7_9BURK|nr:pilus assembly protein PilP [Undibacterium fentianense]MBR7801642.1 pilus assembly protein PilP [Undibacterium fentianense]